MYLYHFNQVQVDTEDKVKGYPNHPKKICIYIFVKKKYYLIFPCPLKAIFHTFHSRRGDTNIITGQC